MRKPPACAKARQVIFVVMEINSYALSYGNKFDIIKSSLPMGVMIFTEINMMRFGFDQMLMVA